MKNIFRTSIASLLLLSGMFASVNAQPVTNAPYLIQPLTVNLTAYEAVDGRSLRIGNRQLIEYFLGETVRNGRLQLVTPVGNPPGLLGGLNAFLRITSGTNILMEIRPTGQFNLLQDVAKLTYRGNRIRSRALNRFSIETSTVRAELQGFSTWLINDRIIRETDISGTGSFTSSVNGWIFLDEVMTDGAAPVSGVIVAGPPTPGR